MSSVSPINGFYNQKSGYNLSQLNKTEPVFSAFLSSTNNNGANAINKINKTNAANTEKEKQPEVEEKKKRNIPWKKIAAGVIIATAFIEFNLRRDPRRKYLVDEYTKLFSNTTGTEIRNFSMIPYRDEIIITEAANGSKNANEMLSSLSSPGEEIKKYIQLQRKIENGRRNYLEGRFEEYSTDTCTTRQIQKSVLKGLEKLQKEADAIYKKHIEPLCKT